MICIPLTTNSSDYWLNTINMHIQWLVLYCLCFHSSGIAVWFQKYTEKYIYILNKHQIIKIPIYGYVSYVVVTIPPFFPLSLIFRRIFENSNTMDGSSTAGTTTIPEHLIRLHLFLLGFPFVQLHIFKYLVSPCDVRDDFCIKRCSSYSQLFYLCLFMYSDV